MFAELNKKFAGPGRKLNIPKKITEDTDVRRWRLTC